MPQDGIPLGDVLVDSGYSHRVPGNWAVPPRRSRPGPGPAPAGPRPQGTHQGAVIANGNLYCPQAPRALLELGPLARGATKEQAAHHDAKAAEAARYKLGHLTSDDDDGYHRVACPAGLLVNTAVRGGAMAEPPGEFAGLLRELRTRARLTQEELAEAAGTALWAVSGLERSMTTTPQRETVRLLAGALHLIGPGTGAVRDGRARPSPGSRLAGRCCCATVAAA